MIQIIFSEQMELAKTRMNIATNMMILVSVLNVLPNTTSVSNKTNVSLDSQDVTMMKMINALAVMSPSFMMELDVI